MRRSLILVFAFLGLVNSLSAGHQLSTFSESKATFEQTWGPTTNPLIHVEAGSPAQPPLTSESHSSSTPVAIGPGTYRLRYWCHTSAWKSVPGSAGAVATAETNLDFGSAQVIPLPSTYGRLRGYLTEHWWGGNQSAWYPYGSPNPFPVTLPLSATIIGVQSPALGAGRAFCHGNVHAETVGNVLHVWAHSLSLSMYSLYANGVGTQATCTVEFVFDFQVTQATTVTLTTSMSCGLEGGQQSFPVTPQVGNQFLNGASGAWFDPPLALGYDFQQTGASLFTDILTLPVGIDGDGLFEVQVGAQSLGQFAEGSRVDFVQLLGNGVPSFRIVGIDPAIDAVDGCFPVKLAFNTPTADFTMTPVLWRAIGTSCSDPVCASCPTTTIAPIGDALEGNLTFGLGISNGPANGAAGFYVGLGSASPAPFPLFCGSVLLPLQTAFFDVGATLLPGTGTCDGSGSILLPLVPTPPLFGLFLTVQAITLCPQGGLGLTHAIEFAIGN